MESIQTDVVVVGAGGGGAVLALALAKKGIRCVVLEQAKGPPSGLRGEILQPNGQQVLDRLGLLERLPPSAVFPVRKFDFFRAGGERLCTVDYDMLAPPYNRALVTLPNAAHHTILDALNLQAPGALRYDTPFREVIRDGTRVVGVRAQQGAHALEVRSRVVVGADGALSKVRDALGLRADVHRYDEAYLIAVFNAAEPIEDARYLVGRKTILGVFPAAGRQVYVFHMIPAGGLERIQAAGLDALRARWRAIDPSLAKTFENLTDWRQTAYLPTGRVRAASWVTDGAALIGDAAHAMNPHASQGRMQAMADAMTLADVLGSSLERDDCSAASLREYERRRRPQVDMLQRLADEQVLFWNAGNPVLAALRDRVFRTLDRNARLRHAVLETTAGLRSRPPFGWLDRLIAAGLLPDPRADRVPLPAPSSGGSGRG